jgi:hypothetical protein
MGPKTKIETRLVGGSPNPTNYLWGPKKKWLKVSLNHQKCGLKSGFKKVLSNYEVPSIFLLYRSNTPNILFNFFMTQS